MFSGSGVSLLDANLAGGSLGIFSSATSWRVRWSDLLILSWPWGLIHAVAVPVAMAQIIGALGRTVQKSSEEAGPQVRAALGAMFYLAWLIPALFAREHFEYYLAPPALLGLAVLASEAALRSSRFVRIASVLSGPFSAAAAGRIIIPLLLILVVANQPFFARRRLATWSECWAEGSTAEIRDRLTLVPAPALTPRWTELLEVAAYLRTQGVGDRQLTCWSFSAYPLYQYLDVRPSSRFASPWEYLWNFSDHQEVILREISQSPQRYIVANIKDPPVDRPGRPKLEPSIWSHDVVFKTDRYRVFKVAPSAKSGE
jgi:hypothetical protein